MSNGVELITAGGRCVACAAKAYRGKRIGREVPVSELAPAVPQLRRARCRPAHHQLPQVGDSSVKPPDRVGKQGGVDSDG